MAPAAISLSHNLQSNSRLGVALEAHQGAEHGHRNPVADDINHLLGALGDGDQLVLRLEFILLQHGLDEVLAGGKGQEADATILPGLLVGPGVTKLYLFYLIILGKDGDNGLFITLNPKVLN